MRTAAAVAPLLAALALAGCGKKSATAPAVDAAAGRGVQTAPAPAPTPEANILVDEAMLARPYAIIGGTVENVGAERLEKLSVEIELKRRADGSVERREATVAPPDLEPGKQGKFSLKVLSEEWSGSRVVKLRSGARPGEVAFKPLPGAKRPPERVKDNVVIVKTPGPKKPSGGGDFINTPDTPYKVP
ncbi:MAG TPA: FxLYD domain-containing protein [Pyrinomonadaceae bacterium]